jgi:hypothetical protein
MNISTSLRIVLGGIIVLILGGLAGWYFYLHMQESTITSTDAAAGLNTPAPSFGGTSGSTQSNQAIATQAFGSSNVTSAGTSSSALWEVDPAAVAGMGFVTSESSEYLYYVERGNGYVFAGHPSDETSVRLTDTLMPKIYQALFADDGSVIERSIDSSGNVTTFLGTISTSTASSSTPMGSTTSSPSAPAALTGVYLPAGIRSVAINRSTKALFYLTADPKGGVDGTSVAWNGTKQKQIFSSAIGSWRPSILDDGTIVLLESPADGVPGYAYTLSAAGTLSPLVRNIAGLTILPKTSSPLLLYGSSAGSTLSLYGVASSSPQLLSIATVADKCVWLPGPSEVAYCAVPTSQTANDFLDTWYQGATHTSDDWWEIDLSNGSATRIYSPSANNVSLDVEDPTIDPSGNYIAFINANNQSLWVLRVAQ